MGRLAGNTCRVGVGVALLCVAQFVVVLDVTIVATALPAIGADLGFRGARVTWVITAYTIVQAGTLLAGGRVADLAGSRRVFRAGLVVFGLASAACAAAWSPAALIVARVAQGCGAALLSPAALACLNDLVPAPAPRRRALGWWTAAAAGGGASGWVLGGVITELAGWRWVFAVNVPIGVAALILAALVLPAVGDRPGVLGGNLTAAALTASTTPAMLTTVLYVQGTLGLPPGRGALLFPAFNLAVIAGSLGCPRVLGRFGARRMLLAGFALVAAGTALLVTLPRAGMPLLTLVAAFAAMGTGLGAASVASTAAGTNAVPAGERGVAAGLLNSTAQLGTALGLAVTSPLVASAAPMIGYRLGFAAAGAIALAGAGCALTVPRRPAPAGPAGRPRPARPTAGSTL